MPLFERPPLDTLAPAKDRWTPIYLEYGRMEVDDASIKWVGSDGLVTRLPVATVSALILGPGTSITHAAVKAAAQCNCPLLWLGEDGLRFYAFGITPNHDNSMARIHASAWAADADLHPEMSQGVESAAPWNPTPNDSHFFWQSV